MVLGWIPCGKGVVDVCDASEWTYQWMQQFTLEYNRLQRVYGNFHKNDKKLFFFLDFDWFQLNTHRNLGRVGEIFRQRNIKSEYTVRKVTVANENHPEPYWNGEKEKNRVMETIEPLAHWNRPIKIATYKMNYRTMESHKRLQCSPSGSFFCGKNSKLNWNRWISSALVCGHLQFGQNFELLLDIRVDVVACFHRHRSSVPNSSLLWEKSRDFITLRMLCAQNMMHSIVFLSKYSICHERLMSIEQI